MLGLAGFGVWDMIGICKVGDMWIGDQIKRFVQLNDDFGLHKSQFYSYLQLLYALLQHNHLLKAVPEFNPLES